MSFGPHDLHDFFSLYKNWKLGLFLTIWLFEHVARINHIKYSPSWLLWTLTNMVRPWFETLGRWLGYVSSFYTYLHLGELWSSLLSLFGACWYLITSPIYMVLGYIKTANLYDHPFLIVFGTSTLFMAGLYAIGYDTIYYLTNEYVAYSTYNFIMWGIILMPAYYFALYMFAMPSDDGDKNIVNQQKNQ